MENKVHQFISPDFANFLFDETIRSETAEEDVTFVHGSKIEYANPSFEWLLLYLQKPIEEIYGQKLWPSYSYTRVYMEGQELTPHFDREAAQVSCTITLGYISHYVWPIFVDKIPYALQPGQGVVYEGYEQLHWREPFRKMDPKEEQNIYWSQVFLHYIIAGGKFDTPEFRYDGKFRKQNGLSLPEGATAHPDSTGASDE